MEEATLGREPAPRTRLVSMGWDGLAMLLVSLLWLGVTGGGALLWCFWRVQSAARRTPAQVAEPGPRLVLGVCLGRGGMPADFAQRLDRARIEAPEGPILVLGGLTSRHVAQTEAAAGRAWLIDRGVAPAAVETEDGSRNTLENLHAARPRLAGGPPPVLITNRYHLARTAVLARGLGLDHRLCAAEDRLRPTPRIIARMLLEAFFLNWYHCGRVTATVLRHRGMLNRIS